MLIGTATYLSPCFSLQISCKKIAEVITIKIFGALKLCDITRQQLALAAKKLHVEKRVSPKADKAMLLRSFAVGLLDKNIIKIVGEMVVIYKGRT